MANYIIVDSVTHRRTRVNAQPSARFGDTIGMVSVTPGEFSALLPHYPIFFRKNGDTGRFEPGALFGLGPAENLFLTDDRWDAHYVPIQVRRQPFRIRDVEEGRTVITVDMDSPRVGTIDGEILFHEDGSASAYLERIASMLRALREGQEAAQGFASQLAEFDLIEPVRLEAELMDGQEVNVEGLYAVKHDALRALSGSRLEAMHAAGWLELAFYQLASIGNVQALIARKNRKLAAAGS
jgi:hypothetical protein